MFPIPRTRGTGLAVNCCGSEPYLLLSSLSFRQQWSQPSTPRFPNDFSILSFSGGRCCQPSVLFAFPACCSWWHCVFCKQLKRPWPAEQQECLGMVNPQKLRNGRSGCLPLSSLLNGPASFSFLLIHQQYFSVSDILGSACTCSVNLCRNVLGFAPSRQPFCGPQCLVASSHQLPAWLFSPARDRQFLLSARRPKEQA